MLHGLGDKKYVKIFLLLVQYTQNVKKHIYEYNDKLCCV